MEHEQIEPNPPADWLVPGDSDPRHDGWIRVTQVAFLERLAATGIVTEACAYAHMSSSAAYSFRRRSAFFAAAWDEALGLARDRLADTLLARSLEWQTKYYYRDGELVGERKSYDSRLGLAMLKRLDRRAEERARAALEGGGPVDPAERDFNRAIEALCTGDDDGVAAALAILRPQPKVPEVDKVDTPPVHPLDRDDYFFDPAEDCWCTRFPPPEHYDGVEVGRWGEASYLRHCDEEEMALIAAVLDPEEDEARSAAVARRAAALDSLRALAGP